MKKKLKFIKAQNFKIPSTDGKIFELNKIKNKYIVIYFYPKDDTPGCTIETNDFKYYIHLKRLKVSTKFTGKTSDLVKLKNDILTYLNK